MQEYIATLFSLRAKNLADVLQNMFEPQAKKLNGINKAYTPFPDGSSKDGSGKLTPNSFFQAVFGGNPRESVGKVMDRAKNTVADITEAKQKRLEQFEGGGKDVARIIRSGTSMNILSCAHCQNPIPCRGISPITTSRWHSSGVV